MASEHKRKKKARPDKGNGSALRGGKQEGPSQLDDANVPSALDIAQERAGQSAAAHEKASAEPVDAEPVDVEAAGSAAGMAAESPTAARAASELEAVRAERDELQERLLRLAADHDNYRKRTAREWQETRKRAAAEVFREMLDLVDNLERALQSSDDDDDGLRKGVQLIYQQLLESLKKFGIDPIDVQGEPFDPRRHEAVMIVDSEELESQHVVDVVQRGYALHGEVLRPARVTVSR